MAREHAGTVLAVLARRFGDLDLADEAVQDALLQAVETWSTEGVPTNPAGWLYTVARNRAVDRLRRAASAERRRRSTAYDLAVSSIPEEDDPMLDLSGPAVDDERLRLMLLCCHPALDRDAQVALTLRLVGGLTTAQISAAFLIPEATMAQRIVRAKRKIRDARIPMSMPARLDERTGAVLAVLYLIFNEGYLSRSAEAVDRVDLAEEAVRLTIQWVALVPGSAEARGLLALELAGQARRPARFGSDGDLVLLADQDRSLWVPELRRRALDVLREALALGDPGPYQLQAMIAAEHLKADRASDTDWATIVGLYRMLEAATGSPVVVLNLAVAVAEASGPCTGLAELDRLDPVALDGYHLLHSTRAELLLRAGDSGGAVAAFDRALALVQNPAERSHLLRRREVARSVAGE